MASLVERLGQRGVGALTGFGEFWAFVYRVWRWLGTALVRARNWQLLLPQCYEIGWRSVPVVAVTGLFVGMVLALQAVNQFKAIGLEHRMGVIVNLAVVSELGPVLAGVMLAGRVGGALTAELGTMRVTEQIDALRAMGADPIRYLVVPRFLACLLLTPVLTCYCNVMGVLGGWFVSVHIFGVASEPYWFYTRQSVELFDVAGGLIKSLFFGGAIGLISCYKGFTCRAGAEGVGRACTEAFVVGFMAILVLDFFIVFVLKGVYDAVWGFKSVL